jgi:single-strand DNA-binding protein
MYNKIILVGNLTRDIELKYTQSSTAVANTAIATSRKFTANGEKKEEVMFVDITFFGRSAEVANQYLRKGSKVLVEGRLILQQWEDQNNNKRSKHSVAVETMQMLDSKCDSQNQAPPQQQQQYAPPQQQYAQPQQGYQQPPQVGTGSGNALPDINDDEIPFNGG